jgi:hypothetical protein
LHIVKIKAKKNGFIFLYFLGEFYWRRRRRRRRIKKNTILLKLQVLEDCGFKTSQQQGGEKICTWSIKYGLQYTKKMFIRI